MGLSDHISVARSLLKAGYTPHQVRAALVERFGELPAEFVMPEIVADVAAGAGEVLSETVGAGADEVIKGADEVLDAFNPLKW